MRTDLHNYILHSVEVRTVELNMELRPYVFAVTHCFLDLLAQKLLLPLLNFLMLFNFLPLRNVGFGNLKVVLFKMKLG